MSGGNDLQATLSADASRLLAGVGAAVNKVKQLGAAIIGVGRDSNQFQQHTSNAFRGAHGHASNLGTKLREMAHAFALAGGGAGHLSHLLGRFGRVASDGNSTLTRMAAAAGLAGLAIEALKIAHEQKMEVVREATEVEERHREAILKGNDALNKSAIKGFSNAETVRELVGRGGVSGLQKARDIARDDGLDVNDVRKALLKSYKIQNQEERFHAIEAARQFARSGAGTIEQGLDLVTKDSAIRATLRGGDSQKAAALAREKTIYGRFQGGDTVELDRAQDAMKRVGLITEAGKANEIKNQITDTDEGRAASGAGVTALREELAKDKDPVSYELVQNRKEMEKQTHILEKQLAAMSTWERIFDPDHTAIKLQHLRVAQASLAEEGGPDQVGGGGE